MTIRDNIISFDAADLEQLSVETQSALTIYTDGLSAVESLNDAVNSFLRSVTLLAPTRSFDKLKRALDAAPAETKAQANVKLDEAKAILGVQFSPSNAAAVK